MKTPAIAIACIALSACTTVHVRNPQGGQATFASLGGDSEQIAISPDGATIASNRNAPSFKTAAIAGTLAYGLNQAAGVAAAGIKQSGLTDRATQSAMTARHGAEQVTTQALDANRSAEAIRAIQSTEKLKALDIEALKITTPAPQP